MEKAQRRARTWTRWGITIAAVAVFAAPVPASADADGYYPAQPTPLRVNGELSRIWAGSVSASPYSSIGTQWLQSAALRYDWRTLPEHGPRGEVMDLVVKAAVERLGYSTEYTLGTPSNASGDSADLGLALALIDAQTPGSLTGGRSIAATGELSPSGAVLPIGGAQAKVTGAQRSGFDIMLIPVGNSADITDPGSVSVAPVKTLKQAVRVLCSLGASDGACGEKKFR